MTRLTALPVTCPTFLSAPCPDRAHNAARYAGIDPVRRRSDSTDLPIVTTAGGRRYVLSEEGLEYDVVVRATDRSLLPVQPGFVLGVDLKVDGQKVGYWYTIGYDNGRWLEQAKFEGFCTQIGGQAGAAGDAYQTTYQRFKFARAEPSQDAGPEVTDPEQIKAGRIEVTLSWYVETGTRQGPPNPGTGVGNSAALGHLPEGKKFFLAPSLKTERGRADSLAVNWNKRSFAVVDALGVMELRYETASTLMLRKALDKDNPAHRQLLRASRDPSVRALLGHGSDEGVREGVSQQQRLTTQDGAGGSGAQQQQRPQRQQQHPGVKRERGSGRTGQDESVAESPADASLVKHEQGGGGASGSGGGSAFLDLTKPQEVPLRVGGREVKTDEIAVCDLLDSDGEEGGSAPRWEVRKRQAVDLDGT